MFALTRPYRQALATLVLLVLSVVPTAFVASWAWRVSRPEHARVVEFALGRALGLQVELAGIRYPRPDTDLLLGVVLRDEESGGPASRFAELARADSVRVTRESGRVALEIEGLRLNAAGPEAAFERLEGLLRRAGLPARVDLIAQRVTWELGLGEGRSVQQLGELAATLRREGTDSTLSMSFRVGSEAAAPRCELQLARSGDSAAPGASARLRSAGTPLPASVLAPFFDTDAWLGAGASLAGTLDFRRRGPSGTPWELSFDGELDGVDLETLVAGRFPGRRLSGRGRIVVERADWGPLPGSQGIGWRSASGRIEAGAGRMGGDLLRALAAELSVRVPDPTSAPPDGQVEFGRLGVAFRLEPSGGLTLAGALGPSAPPGALLMTDRRTAPLAVEPVEPSSVVGLWKALVPAPADVLVPATPEAQVFRFLPLPTSAPPVVRTN